MTLSNLIKDQLTLDLTLLNKFTFMASSYCARNSGVVKTKNLELIQLFKIIQVYLFNETCVDNSCAKRGRIRPIGSNNQRDLGADCR
jgi:hypothetical protein